ncbi:hypothetical protein F3Y22_tig00110933pilonHSYRG00161 [Hibiscus syriacus]|uniref:Uncharacterized protein n=1 Tax=Hibiscus syriacus TaxID=106335 RepID=A0A6A2ZCZ0_HIBSY|nr:hypothetical protein F3Y22_tig00110933pilonHSYRG00161 [Hibiscus syriacus]
MYKQGLLIGMDVILDACCQNIASADEIWQYVVEMSSLAFKEMIPVWLHVDDDETVLLVLKQLHTIVRLTWIRKSPYFERCKGLQFETAWNKHRNDTNLTTLDRNLLVSRDCIKPKEGSGLTVETTETGENQNQ